MTCIIRSSNRGNREENICMKKYRLLIAASLLLYVFYVSLKNIYSAEIIEIMQHFGVSKRDASFATSFSFISYAAMQLVFSRVIEKINVFYYLLIAVPVGCGVYCLTTVCTAIWQVWMLFAVGGGLLAGVFPVCMLVISDYLPDSMVITANKEMGLGFAMSFVLDYFCASLFLHFADWRLGFWFFAVLLLLSTLLFCRVLAVCPRRERVEQKPVGYVKNSRKTVYTYIMIMGTIGFLINMLYYAIANWIPNLLSEVFGLYSSLSVFITLIIPLTGIIGSVVCLDLCKKNSFWNVILIAVGAAGLLAILLAGAYKLDVTLTILLLIILLIIVRGVSHVCGWQVPIEARKIMDPVSAAIIINFFSCVGSAAGPPLFGGIIDLSGYLTFFFAAVFAFLILGGVIAWGRSLLVVSD